MCRESGDLRRDAGFQDVMDGFLRRKVANGRQKVCVQGSRVAHGQHIEFIL